MSTPLTQRYIAATVTNIPAAAQDDVRAELETAITDAVEARVERGEAREAAERAVLTDLGDPAILAARYADRRLHLIGPRYYLTWWRLLKLLLLIVPLCVIGGVALGQALSAAPIGTVLAEAIVAGLGSVVHVCFWVTLVFVILEHTGTDTGVRWDLDQLPEEHRTGTGRVDLIVGLLLLAFAAGATLWDRFLGLAHLDGQTVTVLHLNLWPWLLTLIALQVVFTVVLYLRRRWSTTFAVVNTALAVLFVSLVLTALGRGFLFNPEFVTTFQLTSGVDDDTMRILAVLAGFGAVAFAIWSVVDGWLSRRRDARAGHERAR